MNERSSASDKLNSQRATPAPNEWCDQAKSLCVPLWVCASVNYVIFIIIVRGPLTRSELETPPYLLFGLRSLWCRFCFLHISRNRQGNFRGVISAAYNEEHAYKFDCNVFTVGSLAMGRARALSALYGYIRHTYVTLKYNTRPYAVSTTLISRYPRIFLSSILSTTLSWTLWDAWGLVPTP